MSEGGVMAGILEKMRLDKWLWAARFYKTRSLAAAEVEKNRVQVNEQYAKPARDIKVGDKVTLQQGTGVYAMQTVVVVAALSPVRGPAPVARTLYAETPESVQAKEALREKRRFMQEPASSIKDGRPTKKDRRDLAEWQRWSVSVDDE